MNCIGEIGLVVSLGTSDQHGTCAYWAIQCLARIGIAKQTDVFNHHIENAKALGIMPDEIRVVNATLSDYNFVKQSYHMNGISINGVINILRKLNASATVFLLFRTFGTVFTFLSHDKYFGGYAVAIRLENDHDPVFYCADPQPDNLALIGVKYIWIRWDDGIDRSPYPEETVSISTLQQKAGADQKTECYPPFEETEFYRYFQPNPCSNYTVDWVVRGIAGVLDISWEEAMDRLASFGETTINHINVFAQLLKREGFVQLPPLEANGHRLRGNDFCKVMQQRYHNGERIFAVIDRYYCVAIVPTAKNSCYKILDTRNSSQGEIGEYWVGPCPNLMMSADSSKNGINGDPVY